MEEPTELNCRYLKPVKLQKRNDDKKRTWDLGVHREKCSMWKIFDLQVCNDNNLSFFDQHSSDCVEDLPRQFHSRQVFSDFESITSLSNKALNLIYAFRVGIDAKNLKKVYLRYRNKIKHIIKLEREWIRILKATCMRAT